MTPPENSAYPPGEYLRDALAARGMTMTELAKRMGRPLAAISRIANARAPISPRTAIQLEKALDIPAATWLNLEVEFQLRLARLNQQARENLPQHAWEDRP